MRPARVLVVISVIFFLVLIIFGIVQIKNRLGNGKIDQNPTGISGIAPTPVVAETDNWREYKNLEYNYAFRYPRDWAIAQVLPTEPDTINQAVLTSPSGKSVVFSVVNNPYALSSAQMADKFTSSASAQILERSEVKVSGFIGELVINGEISDIAVTKGVLTYRILSSLGQDGEDKKNYAKILDTYIFI